MATSVKYVYRIIDRLTELPQGVYTRGNYDKYDFASEEAARTANCHGVFEDADKYEVRKFRVTYDDLDECGA